MNIEDKDRSEAESSERDKWLPITGELDCNVRYIVWDADLKMPVVMWGDDIQRFNTHFMTYEPPKQKRI